MTKITGRKLKVKNNAAIVLDALLRGYKIQRDDDETLYVWNTDRQCLGIVEDGQFDMYYPSYSLTAFVDWIKRAKTIIIFA